MQEYKDGSGLQFINFDFVTGGQEIQVFILVEFRSFLVVLLSFSTYSLRLEILNFFSSYIKSKQLAIIMKTGYFSRNRVPFKVLAEKKSVKMLVNDLR